MRKFHRSLTSICLLCALACGGDSPVTPATPSLVTVGRAERGLAIHVGVQLGSDTTLVNATNVSVSPADAATITATNDVFLTKAGTLQISGTAPDGTSLTLSLIVATPPLIVFDGTAAGNRDVYTVMLDGAGLTRLTTNAADDVHPSAAGGSVLFTSYRDGDGELYSIPVGGGTERRLTETDENETQVALAPDGKHVTYTSDVSGTNKVWIGAIDLAAGTSISSRQQLSASSFGSPISSESTPAWAPTSNQIVLVATATPSGGAGLFTATAAAGTTPTIVMGSGTQSPEVEPAWSPDGFHIAYASVIAGSTEIFVRDVRTGAVTQVTHNTGSSGQPSWLLDGRVVYTTNGPTSTLHWVDPAKPLELHSVSMPGLAGQHAAAVRP